MRFAVSLNPKKMINSSNKPIRVVIAGSDISVVHLLRVILERLQFSQTVQVVESLVLDEAQVIENVSTICNDQADWVFLMHYYRLQTVDRVAKLIKQTQPHTKVSALSVVIRDKEPEKSQYLDYWHYYPIFGKHFKEAVEHLLKI